MDKTIKYGGEDFQTFNYNSFLDHIRFGALENTQNFPIKQTHWADQISDAQLHNACFLAPQVL